MKKFAKIGCLGFIGLIILMAIVGVLTSLGGEEAGTSTDAPATEAPAAEEQAAEPAAAKEEAPKEEVVGIGKEINVENVFFTVNEVTTATELGGEYGVKAQSQYTVVNVTIRNEKNEAITVDSSFFKLLSGERTYESDSSAAIYANEDTMFFFESVNPGVALTGNVVFDVPADLENPQMQVQTGMFGTETGVMNLK